MARGIVYPPAVIADTSKVKNHKAPKPEPLTEGEEKLVDGYRDKLIKYVPVEATIFFALAYGKLGDQIEGSEGAGRGWWALILVVGALIAILFAGAGTRDRAPLPWYFYLLTAAAFVAWAIGTTGIAQEMFPEFLRDANDVVFAAAAFIIPGVDQLLTRGKEQKAAGDIEPPASGAVSGGGAPPGP